MNSKGKLFVELVELQYELEQEQDPSLKKEIEIKIENKHKEFLNKLNQKGE